MEKTEKPVFEPMPETPAEPASTASESAGQPAASLAEAKKNILIGLLWCVGGLAFSFISYYLTEAGGRYVIATGAILWGAWQAIMGLYVWLKIKHGAGEYAAFWRMLATAVCTALLIGYLTVLSTQLVDEGGELPLLDTEQTYDCTDLGCESGFRPDTPPSKRALNPKPTQPTPATRCTSSTANGNSTSTPCKMSSIPRRRASPTSRTTARAAIRPTTTAGSSRPRAPSYRTAPTCCTAKAARTEYPGFVFTAYDLKQGQSLITVGISYPSKEYGKTSTLRRVEELLRGIELTQPEETAGTAE